MLKSASEQMDGITAEQIRLEGTGIRWTPLGREEFTLTYNSLSEDFVHETYRDVISDPGSETIVTADEINRVPALLGSPTDHCMPLRALQLDEDIVRRQNPTTRERTVLLWLDKSLDNLRALGNNESYQERLCRLEGDKESLVLQVSVLTDQVAAQGEKIRDLENSLEEHQLKLNSTEEMLQQELLSRTAFESQKLNLMDEVSSLNLKLVNMEERQSPSTERQHKAESLLQELRLLKNKVEELEDEKSQYERKLKASKAEISSLQHLLQCRNAEIENLQAQLLSRSPISIDNSEREELYRRRLNTKHQELLKLKAGMELLIAANDEKDRRIEELSLLLTHCRQLRDGKALLQQTSAPQCSSEEEEQSTALRAKPLTLKAHSEMMSGASSPLLPSKSPEQKETDMRSQPRNTSGSQEDLKSEELKPVMGSPAEPASSDEGSQPKPVNGKCVLIEGNKSDGSESRSQEGSQDGDMSQGKAERPEESSACDASPSSSGVDSGEHSPVSQENLKNNKSIRKLWGKIKRTQSGALGTGDDLEPTEFRRGGFRATAGPRLARTPDSGRSVRDMTVPFSNWTTEQVCGWLEDFGLGQYVSLARQWVMSGQTLLSATPQEFEKEMAIKHPLHRKKLQLALRSFNNKAMEKSSELDHIWVTRWLDDIGLPQYKDQFHESRVDGRVLQYLTVNDLLFLKVTSQLHHLSIKCAIHVLHANKFNPHCLRRRPGDENKTSPSEVVQWSNHRVMEWLRSVDLAEYAPNLRGSGVHGGLIILEPRFTSETLAMLLNIPPQKTLLRRHLTTNFSSLVGAQAQQEKREYSNASGHTPLTTTAKVRPKKLGFTNFSHLRKRRPDESADYICPVEMGNSPILNGTTHQL
ncbi:liprin-beta-2 isoform X5 [Tachysurus fulvidraco]|uniref:liprin-beta-2 isoform X5 n=1 Tax=Tachysurus fulvidraco TaxID=1234273 RepID=UPI001FEFF7BF|nr:liprin-beta-2 isoform X5 [Tachysurus fulvidraco]